MKRVISSSNCPKHIKLSEIVDYLNENRSSSSTLTDDDIREMAKEIGQYLRQEEMEYGEPYESIYDADIDELCDAATTDLHDKYYNLVGLIDDED